MDAGGTDGGQIDAGASAGEGLERGGPPVLARGRVDRVRLHVALRRQPDGPALEHFLLDLPVPEGAAPTEDRYLAALDPVVRGDGAALHHSLHVHRWHTSWGLATGALDIGLTVTCRTDPGPDSGPRAAVLAAYRELLGDSEAGSAPPLTRDAAVAAARRAVAAAFALDAGALELASEEHQVARETWNIGLRSGDHRYVVAVGLVDGYAGSAHVRADRITEVADSLGTV